jgi:hypothetical protein
MKRLMLVIIGMLVAALAALGFLVHSASPFTATMGIKSLFLLSVFIAAVSFSMIVFYAVAVGWHSGMRYFFANYFGPEAPYFKTAFRRSVLLGVLVMALIGLSRFGFFTRYFAGGATAIILLLELFYSAHDKQAKNS